MNELDFVLKFVDKESLTFHPMSILMQSQKGTYTMFAETCIIDEYYFVAKDPVIIKIVDDEIRYIKPFIFSDDRQILYKRQDAQTFVSLSKLWESRYRQFVDKLYNSIEPEDELDELDSEPEPSDEQISIKPVLH